MDKGRLLTTPAQRDEMLQAELPDSLIVYDVSTSQGHDLQPIAAFVWRSCDGRTSVSDIARLVKDKYGIESGEEVVLFILDQLRGKRLLKEAPDQPRIYSLISRRDMVRKYIPAAMVLPFILSAAAPTTAQLISGGPTPSPGPDTSLPESFARVGVEGGNLPSFVFFGSTLSLLLVSRVKRKGRNNLSPADVDTEDGLDTHWLIEGNHDANVPITYGVVPSDMKGVVSAKPLAEGELYFVHSKIHTDDGSSCEGQYFRIQDGKAVEIH